MEKPKAELLQGTLDMLILKTLSLGPMHGFGIARRIEQVSREVLRVDQGSLYPALHRMEAKGWVGSVRQVSEANRRAKYYRLTPSGRKQLSEETKGWLRVREAIGQVMETA